MGPFSLFLASYAVRLGPASAVQSECMDIIVQVQAQRRPIWFSQGKCERANLDGQNEGGGYYYDSPKELLTCEMRASCALLSVQNVRLLREI